MYNLEFLPIANNDITEALFYITQKLCNKTAAENLADEIEKAIALLSEFPYSNPVYNSKRPLGNEYRKMIINNYLMFYTVNEYKKLVTVYRFIYSGRNYENII